MTASRLLSSRSGTSTVPREVFSYETEIILLVLCSALYEKNHPWYLCLRGFGQNDGLRIAPPHE